MKVTPSFALLNGADKPCLAVTIKLDGHVLTYSSLETDPEQKQSLILRKKRAPQETQKLQKFLDML